MDGEREDDEMAIAQRELEKMQKQLMKMSKEERKEFMRNLAHRVYDRNDKAYRRLSKS